MGEVENEFLWFGLRGGHPVETWTGLDWGDWGEDWGMGIGLQCFAGCSVGAHAARALGYYSGSLPSCGGLDTMVAESQGLDGGMGLRMGEGGTVFFVWRGTLSRSKRVQNDGHAKNGETGKDEAVMCPRRKMEVARGGVSRTNLGLPEGDVLGWP